MTTLLSLKIMNDFFLFNLYSIAGQVSNATGVGIAQRFILPGQRADFLAYYERFEAGAVKPRIHIWQGQFEASP